MLTLLLLHAVAQVRLGFLAPFKSDCPSCGAAFVSAMVHTNTTFGLLHDSTSQTDALEGAIDITEQGVDVLISDLYSSRVEFTSRVCEIKNTSCLGYGSTSDAFTNKVTFPAFSRVVSPDRFQTTAMVKALQHFGWDDIGIVFSDEAYGTNFNQELTRATSDANIRVRGIASIKHASASSDMELPIGQLKAKGVHVIVLATISTDVTNALLAAQAVGAMGPDYVWIGSDGVMTRSLFTGNNFVGVLGLFPRYSLAAGAVVRSAVLTNKTWEGHPLADPHFYNTATPLNPWAYYVWDAVVHAANATKAAKAAGCGTNQTCIQDFLRNTTTQGVTGLIELDAFGDRSGSYSVLNWQPGANDFVPVGDVVGNTTTIDTSLVVWGSGATGAVPGDGDFSAPSSDQNIGEIVAPVVVVFVLLIVGIVIWLKRNERQKIRKLHDQIAKMGTFRKALNAWGPKQSSTDNTADEAALEEGAEAKWFWKNDSDHWEQYKPDVNGLLEEGFGALEQKAGPYGDPPRLFTVTINTAKGAKEYRIDVMDMKQTNTATNYQRDVQRVGARARTADSAQELFNLNVPGTIVASGEPILEIRPGDLIDVVKFGNKKERTKGWARGNAYAENPDAVQRQGWFPLNVTQDASAEELFALKQKLGIDDDSVLDPPDTWETSANDDPSKVKLVSVPVTSPEYHAVEGTFMQTLGGQNARVVKIERVQNLSLWQSYKLKEIQIAKLNEGCGKPLVRDVAWHGSLYDVVMKIVQQGFNRSFCGRNMCARGRGVYFARDTSYSAQPQYAHPDKNGVCRMIRCRVAHGLYCVGKNNALAPDELDPVTHRLYDSTVDDLHNPIMWVTYHDAQAYPEYIVHFVL